MSEPRRINCQARFTDQSKTFYHYIIPSVGSSLVTALYFVVDGIFVGRGVGPLALAAINLSLPFIIFIISSTMMLTMGGATLTSISLGERNIAAARQFFRLTMLMVMVFCLLAVLAGMLFPRQIALISGASEAVLADTIIYLRYYSMFSLFSGLSMCLAVFVRNDGNPRLALWGMMTGAALNIFLDWLFIFPLAMGLKGAAIASGIGQIGSCIVLTSHFWRKCGQLTPGKININLHNCWQIIKRGTPEFITQMNQTVTIFIYNILAMKYLGEIGVAAFAIVCYLMEVTIACFLGVSQGIQPLISFSYGEKNHADERYYFVKGLRFNVLFSLIVYLLLFFGGSMVASIFNSDTRLITLTQEILRIYSISFVLAAVNIVFTTYYLAIKRTGKAIVIATARSFVLNTALIFLLPAIFGSPALWLGIVAAELIVAAYCLLTRPKPMLLPATDISDK
jgi:putative MATE family efflux protein